MGRKYLVFARFLSEDDVATFDGWLEYQGIDPNAIAADELQVWREIFEAAEKARSSSGKVGLMKLQPNPGEYRYAVAVREANDLWLALWVQRSRRGEYFVLLPRVDRRWDRPH